MAAVAGQGTTFNLPNFVGELFALTPLETPFLSMIGGLTGGEEVSAKEFTYQTYDLAAASQPSIVEGADPSYGERDRAEVTNVTQIFQYGAEVSYSKLGATSQLGTVLAPASAPPTIGAPGPVMNEFEWQSALKLDQCAIDVEYSFLNGTYQKPTTNGTGRQTRGMFAAVTTNEVAAAAAALSKSMFDSLLVDMYANGAAFRMPVIFCNAFQKQAITAIYGLAPRDRNFGGLAINTIETDVGGVMGIVLDRHVPADDILVADVSVCRPRFMPIPGKGHLFFEPLAQTGAALKGQLYGEIGLEYGPETWHGKITNLAIT